jgi:dihydroorotase-like cyclic amidohydrolase
VCANDRVAIETKGRIESGYDANLKLVDGYAEHSIRNKEQLTKVKWSPWDG